jgi:hypothetical protein
LLHVYASEHLLFSSLDVLVDELLLPLDLLLPQLVCPDLLLPHLLLQVVNHMPLLLNLNCTLLGSLYARLSPTFIVNLLQQTRLQDVDLLRFLYHLPLTLDLKLYLVFFFSLSLDLEYLFSFPARVIDLFEYPVLFVLE